MKKFSALGFMLTITLLSPAQKEFYKGLIVKETGDTLHGYVHLKENGFSPEKISFKDSQGAAKYGTPDLKEFAIVSDAGDTAFFRKAIVTYASSRVRLVELTVSDSALLIHDTVFLQLIIDGPLKLYQLKTYSFRTHYYMQGADASFSELVYRKYYSEIADQPTAVVMRYKFQLLAAMKKCSTSARIIDKMRYNEKDLRRAFFNYGACFGENKITYIRNPERFKYSITIFGGFIVNWVKYPTTIKTDKSKTLTGMGYAAGSSFNLQFSRSMPKLWLHTEIGIMGFKMKGNLPRYYSNFAFHTKHVSIHLLYLQFHLLPAYYFGNSRSKVVPYISGGPYFRYLIKTIENNAYLDDNPDTNIQAFTNLKNYELGFSASVGLQILQYAGIEARYQSGNGFLNINGQNTQSLTLTARLNIAPDKKSR